MNNLYNLNLKVLDNESAVITGTEMALTNQENGKVYTTSKPYMDKLFNSMGYKSTYVVKILEEYAGKTLTSTGSLMNNEKVWIDDGSDTFIVTTSFAIDWVKSLFDFLENNKFKIVDAKRFDTTYYWDQLVVESETVGKFAIYIDLCDEYVSLYQLSYDFDGVLCDICDQSTFKFNEEGSLDEIKNALTYPTIDLPADFSCPLSIQEFVDLCRTLVIVRIKRKVVYPIDDYDKIVNFDLQSICDSYNEKSWIQRRIKEVPKINLGEASRLINSLINRTTYYSLRNFFKKYKDEISDLQELNR